MKRPTVPNGPPGRQYFVELDNYLRGLTQQTSPDFIQTVGSNGTHQILRRRYGRTTSAQPRPWDIIRKGGLDFTFAPGNVSNQEPSNLYDLWTMADDATYDYWLGIGLDFGSGETASESASISYLYLDFGAECPANESPGGPDKPTKHYVLLGSITAADGFITEWHNQCQKSLSLITAFKIADCGIAYNQVFTV